MSQPETKKCQGCEVIITRTTERNWEWKRKRYHSFDCSTTAIKRMAWKQRMAAKDRS